MGKKQSKWMLASITAVLGLSFVMTEPVANANTLNNLKQKQEEVQQKANQLNSNISEKKGDISKNQTKQEQFTCAPRAFLGGIRYGALLIIIGVFLYWITLYADLGLLRIDRNTSLILLLIAAFLCTFAFIYFIFEVMLSYEVVDFLFPKKKSYNIGSSSQIYT